MGRLSKMADLICLAHRGEHLLPLLCDSSQELKEERCTCIWSPCQPRIGVQMPVPCYCLEEPAAIKSLRKALASHTLYPALGYMRLQASSLSPAPTLASACEAFTSLCQDQHGMQPGLHLDQKSPDWPPLNPPSYILSLQKTSKGQKIQQKCFSVSLCLSKPENFTSGSFAQQGSAECL